MSIAGYCLYFSFKEVSKYEIFHTINIDYGCDPVTIPNSDHDSAVIEYDT